MSKARGLEPGIARDPGSARPGVNCKPVSYLWKVDTRVFWQKPTETLDVGEMWTARIHSIWFITADAI